MLVHNNALTTVQRAARLTDLQLHFRLLTAQQAQVDFIDPLGKSLRKTQV